MGILFFIRLFLISVQLFSVSLEHCGLTDEADILREAKALWETDEDQYEETYSDFSDRLVLFSDSDRFWDCVRAYIDANIT